MTNNAPSCFAIVPFKAPFSDYYKNIYRPAILEADIQPIRGDDFITINPIMSDIWESIVQCQICIADLSGNNPNVMFEVGLAMAIDKPIVFMTQTIGELPFDLKGNRVIEYHPSDDPEWETLLKQRLILTLRELVHNLEKVKPPTWKTAQTDAEKIYSTWKQHGQERTNLVDITDPMEPAYADEFFLTDLKEENRLIERAKSELWLIYETGSLVLQKNFAIIRDFLRAGGTIRLLLVSETIHEQLLFRHRFVDPDYLPGRYKTTHMHLRQFAAETGFEVNSPQLSVRWLPFPVNFVGVFIEPNAVDQHERYATVRLIGFRTYIEHERALVMRGDLSPKTFGYYIEQFNHMWDAASSKG